MYISDAYITKLSLGQIQLKHTKKVKDENRLNVILLLAFPDDMLCDGTHRYYLADPKSKHQWYTMRHRAKKDVPIVELNQFYTF